VPPPPSELPDLSTVPIGSDTGDLLAALRALGAVFDRVGGELSEAAVRVREHGVLPDQRLVDEAAACGRSFAALREALAGRLEALGPGLGLPPLPRGEGVGLAALVEQAEALARAEHGMGGRAATRRLALERLDRARAIRHRDPAASDLLRLVADSAESLRGALDDAPAHAEPPPEALRLAEGSHPLAVLLRFLEAEAGEPLADDDWAAHHRTIAEAFGQPLAAAAARGRLVLTPEGPEATPSPDPPPSAADLTDAALGAADVAVIRPGPGRISVDHEPANGEETTDASETRADLSRPT
jgi:hypothetical protein